MGTIFVQLAVASVLWMLLLWVFQIWKRDAGIVDAGWALGLFGAALSLALDAPGSPPPLRAGGAPGTAAGEGDPPAG